MKTKIFTLAIGVFCSINLAFAQAPTGGTITTDGNYTVHTFTSSGTFTASSSISAEVLVVAGGGGGGGQVGGGGGGGGVIYDAAFSATTGAHTVTVGDGGQGGHINQNFGQQSGFNGQNSVFSSLTAIGGGGGGGYVSGAPPQVGGSGGGGGYNGNLQTGAQGTSGQGYAGGNANSATNWGGGGGGGAGGIGGNGGANIGGDGGVGFQSSINGTLTYYAGGGGGCTQSGTLVGAGGLGGGGRGGNNNGCSYVPQHGTPNTGGGGGGSRDYDVNCVQFTNANGGSGDGGSGIVIVRYLTNQCTVVDQALTATDASVSSGNATTITTASSETTAYYTLYEATNNTVVDSPKDGTGSSLSFNTGNLTTATDYYTVARSLNTALQLNGTSNSVTLPTTMANATTTNGTMEAWIKTAGAGSGLRAILILKNGYGLWLNDNNLLSYDGGFPTFTGVSLNDNEWHHVAMTFQSGVTNGSKFYIDGLPVHTFTFTVSAINYGASQNAIGRNASGQYFSGQIDEVRLWNIAKNDAQVLSDYATKLEGNETNLVAYYDFEEGAANTLNDLTSNNYNGTITGASWIFNSRAGEPTCSVTSASNVSVGITPPPTISSFTPTSGAIGTSVTITGTDFNATFGNNIVFFGATQATVTAGNATSLTVTVPAGATHQPITVLSNGFIASSAAPFITTFNGSTIDATSFAAKVDFATGSNPTSVAIGDVDNDGNPDLVVANLNSSSISVFHNTGSSFSSKVDFALAGTPNSVVLADMDGDGLLDILAPNRFSNSTSVLLNTNSVAGTISFASKADFSTGVQITYTEAADIDGDGKQDLIFTNVQENTVSVRLNTGSVGALSFAAKNDFSTGNGTVAVAVGDIDLDGKPDLAVVNVNVAQLMVLRNTSSVGTASFAGQITFTTGSSPSIVKIGDLDADGKPEVVVANNGSASISVFHNTNSVVGTISLAAKSDFVVGNASSVAIGDLDGDGKPDLLSSSASVLSNTSTVGSISFATKVDFVPGSNPKGVAIGDLNGDGKPDIVIANQGAATVSVITNTVSPPCTTVDQALTATDATVCSGSATTITTASSESGVNYSLYEATGNTVVDGPTAGTGSSLSFATGNLSAATDYYVTAVLASNTSCTVTSASNVSVGVTTIVDQALTATDASVCSGSATTITTASSETGVSYSLKEATGNTVVAGPTTGTGSSLSFATGNLSTATDFYVEASSQGTATTAGNGNAVDFSSTYATTNIDINPTNLPNFTFSAWVKRTQASTHYHQIVSNDNGGFDRALGVYSDNNYHIFAGRDINTGISTALNIWEHVAVYWSSTAIKLYKNGSLVFSTTGESIISGPNASIGAGPNGSLSWQGEIDEAAFWSKELSLTEVQTSMNSCNLSNELDLVAHFQMNEGSGNSLTDVSSNSNTATINGTASWISGYGCGGSSACSVTSASNVSVGITADPSFSLTAENCFSGAPISATIDVNPSSITWKEGSTVLSTNTTFTFATSLATIGGGSAGSGLGNLQEPTDVVEGPDGAIYVTDQQNNRIMRYEVGNSTGTVYAGGNGSGTGLNQLNTPYGLDFDSQGNLYVAEINGQRVIKFPPNSTSSTNGTVIISGQGQCSDVVLMIMTMFLLVF